MHRNEILATIRIAHHFGSAFNREQLYNYLRVEMDKKSFNTVLDGLIKDKTISQKNNLLFSEDLENICHQKKKWSKNLFKENRKYIECISKLSWIRYIGLTGANSFESCEKEDDIDLFIITSPNRLWICYFMLVLFGKLTGKREILCVNYLVDEDNLEIQERNYFNAVQLIQMMPIFDYDGLHKKIIEKNPWIFKILPNAISEISQKEFYSLKENVFSANGRAHSSNILLDRFNRKIHDKYSSRLKKKYPESYGNGIVLGEGMAKLNRVDNQNIYEELFTEMDEADSL